MAQLDFVKLLQEVNEASPTLYARMTGDRRLEVIVPFKGTRCAHYGFKKDARDDFIKSEDGAVSVLETASVEEITGSVAVGDGWVAKKRFDALQAWSNKEFALNVRLADSGAGYWLPEHNGTGTLFALSQRIFFDDALMQDQSPGQILTPVTSVKIEQRLTGKHPDDPAHPMAEVYCLHTITSQGVAVNVKVTWLRPVLVARGYGMMFPVVRTFADKLWVSSGNAYDATAADGSVTNLTEHDQASSYAFVHSGGGSVDMRNTVAAMTVSDIAKTFRHGQQGRRPSGSIVWLQHRNQAMQKLYPHVYDNYTAEAGETYEASGTYFIGELPTAHRLSG